MDLPIPPLEMRELVGPTAPAAFDNPTGHLVFQNLLPEYYRSVFDFGCGCGRIARQLIQQSPRPERYLGIDLHRGMIRWCQKHLQAVIPSFEFVHHDVFNLGFNPGADKPSVLPFPAPDHGFTLVNAWSVFTHVSEEQAGFYMRECSRVLAKNGIFQSTWFLFDKSDFPMMQDFQNALFINDVDPSNAVIFDHRWLWRLVREAGMTIFNVIPPTVRGYQWVLHMALAEDDRGWVDIPEDSAARGIVRPPVGRHDAHRIGTEETS